MASKTARAPVSQIDHGQIRLNTFLRMFASLVAGGSLLLVTGLFTERGFDKMTLGLMMAFVALFLVGLSWWWYGIVLYKKLSPQLTDQERLLWQGASIRDMRRLLASINAGEKRLREEAQSLYQMASAFPGLQYSKDFQRAVRSLNIRACEQMLRVEEIHRHNTERVAKRKAVKELASSELARYLQRLGVSQSTIDQATLQGRRELETLFLGALRRQRLLAHAKELGIESLALRSLDEDEGHSNIPLTVLIARAKEMKAKALSYGVHTDVNKALREGDMEKAAKLLADHENRLLREREVEVLSKIAETLPSEQLDAFKVALTQLRALLENPRAFRIEAYDLRKVYSTK